MSRGGRPLPGTGSRAELEGTYVDEHGCTVALTSGQEFPPCPEGETFWWHEDLPVAKHMVWEAERRAAIMERQQDEG
ncbi:MAG: hypothetical protein KY437_10080 [Actinobacteria bacterium]|nr:hypothetical protein [Actinomycetota bacterium]